MLARDDGELERAAEGDAALDVVRARYREPFVAALRAAVAGLDARGRTLLRLHYVDGLGIDRIAPLFGVHRSSIAQLAHGRASAGAHRDPRRAVARRGARRSRVRQRREGAAEPGAGDPGLLLGPGEGAGV
ncbi:MAG: hypothetical protein U0168_26990 [Nannocystaceae bacterium]